MDIFLIHGKAGSPDGSSLHLEQLLRPLFPSANFQRPLLPHSDPDVMAEDSLDTMRSLEIPEGAYLIGISLGGLLAARLQETGRPDLHVLAVSAPIWADNVHLATWHADRVALYSSEDTVLGGGTSDNRTTDWPRLAEAHDLPWLSHDTKAHKQQFLRSRTVSWRTLASIEWSLFPHFARQPIHIVATLPEDMNAVVPIQNGSIRTRFQAMQFSERERLEDGLSRQLLQICKLRRAQ
jgi:pimeloyl-ACP methyl ester carboxylesterase